MRQRPQTEWHKRSICCLCRYAGLVQSLFFDHPINPDSQDRCTGEFEQQMAGFLEDHDGEKHRDDGT